MITVNCRDMPSLKSPLAIFTSDRVGAVPALKINEFVLSPIEDEDIDPAEVIQAIKIFLESIAIDKHFAVIRKEDTISVVSIDDYNLEIKSGPTDQFFSCVHCGHVTPYETVHNTHMKIHYL
ncbi:MAG: C2H2-type zinc finger protein [Nitrososphaera sp.]